jgi:hypothetical protein
MKTGFDYEFDPNQKIASKIYLFISIFIDIKLMVRAYVYTLQNSFSIVKGPLGQEEFGRGTINSEKLKNAASIRDNVFNFAVCFYFSGQNFSAKSALWYGY